MSTGTVPGQERKRLGVRLLTPEGAVFDDLAYMVIAPSVDGRGRHPAAPHAVHRLPPDGRDPDQAARRQRAGLRDHRGLRVGGGGPGADAGGAGRAGRRDRPRPRPGGPRAGQAALAEAGRTRSPGPPPRAPSDAPRTASGWPTASPAGPGAAESAAAGPVLAQLVLVTSPAPPGLRSIISGDASSERRSSRGTGHRGGLAVQCLRSRRSRRATPSSPRCPSPMRSVSTASGAACRRRRR